MLLPFCYITYGPTSRYKNPSLGSYTSCVWSIDRQNVHKCFWWVSSEEDICHCPLRGMEWETKWTLLFLDLLSFQIPDLIYHLGVCGVKHVLQLGQKIKLIMTKREGYVSSLEGVAAQLQLCVCLQRYSDVIKSLVA